jgi:hypothetical protein
MAKQFDPAYVFDRKPDYLVIVLAGPRGPIGPGAGRRLGPWTPIEGRLLQHPAFREHYAQQRQVDASASGLEQFAASLGAVRVFQHDHHELNYLLAVFAYR